MANSFIYPKNNPSDVLEFQYHPDKHTEKFRLLGGDSDHPTSGRSVSQLTGRASPTFTFSTMWDSLDPFASDTFDRSARADAARIVGAVDGALQGLGLDNGPTASELLDDLDGEFDAEDAALAGLPRAGGPAGRAYSWIVRNIGPRGRVDPDTAPIFVLKLIGQPMQVRITDVDVDHEFITRPTGGTKAPARVLRFKANFSGTQFFDSVVDTRLFNVVRKVRRKPKSTFPQGGKGTPTNLWQDTPMAMNGRGTGVRYTTELAEIKALQQVNRDAVQGVAALQQFGSNSLTEERTIAAVQEGIRQNEQRINALAGRVGPQAIVEDFVKSVSSTLPPVDTTDPFGQRPAPPPVTVSGTQVANAVELLGLVPVAASGAAGIAQLEAEAFPTPPSATNTGSAFSDQAVAEELAKVNAFTDAYARVPADDTPVPEPTKLNMPTLMLMSPLDVTAADADDTGRIQMPTLMLMKPLDVTAPDPEDTENVTAQYPLPPPSLMYSGGTPNVTPGNMTPASFQPDDVGPPAPPSDFPGGDADAGQDAITATPRVVSPGDEPIRVTNPEPLIDASPQTGDVDPPSGWESSAPPRSEVLFSRDPSDEPAPAAVETAQYPEDPQEAEGSGGFSPAALAPVQTQGLRDVSIPAEYYTRVLDSAFGYTEPLGPLLDTVHALVDPKYAAETAFPPGTQVTPPGAGDVNDPFPPNPDTALDPVTEPTIRLLNESEDLGSDDGDLPPPITPVSLRDDT